MREAAAMILSVLLTDDLVWELWMSEPVPAVVFQTGDSPVPRSTTELTCILRTRSKAEVLRALERLLGEWL